MRHVHEGDFLRARWQTKEGLERALEAVLRLEGGLPLGPVACGEIDGRVDLRGLVSPAPLPLGAVYRVGGLTFERVTGATKIDGRTVKDVDLSHSLLADWILARSELVNCRFDFADCSGWAAFAPRVLNCSFRRTKLRDVSLGAWSGNDPGVYEGVDFSSADMKYASAQSPHFIDCDFASARLVKTDFSGAAFTRCRFKGALREVVFSREGRWAPLTRKNHMEEVDFSEADLRHCEFHGLDLDTVIWPSDESHVIVRAYRCVVERLLAEERWSGQAWRKAFDWLIEFEYRWLGADQQIGLLVNLKDLGPEYADYLEDFLSAVREMEQECLQARGAP